MNAREFLKHYRYDDRLVTGRYYPQEPIKAESGETVGVVLMNLGGPDTLDDIEPFLYNLFMDPAIIDMPVGRFLRHWISKLISTTRSKKVGKDYTEIGGGSPINRLTKEQAENLESFLNQKFGQPAGIRFRVYIAMRYWKPTTEQAVQKMQKDNVDKVVLLPLYPHYSKTTTGSSLIYWWILEQQNEIPKWPTTYVFEYAAHPKFVWAISERIDEALERFPENVRDKVQLVFSAHGTPLLEMKRRRDPYCCLIHSTVEQVMKLGKKDRPFHVAFQSKVGPAEWLTPSTPDKLKELAEQGEKAVLIIPVAFVTDHIETLYELDIEIREEAEEFGIEHYEVSKGLNSHPLFIEALAEATVSQVTLPGDGKTGLRPIQELPKYTEEKRSTRCHQCEHIIEAIRWEAARVKEKVSQT
ncbi:ferrochelatase [candidate division KSB1 bacterium]|nr:ferrochelatase [candidate division KSB1 bacterium]NIR73373.1 ferrochelatase [candidate division KSB1 bacterium]NIS27056.1 ferrochelatase [candidate division KSB1 bacterium]NIT73896.1 ferrochelatase [candidate division KSB1 bacterium]NIU27801.1 ferrochelatase [candidate division KSB1 bacterium]